MYEFQERELLISILKCLVIKYTILPMRLLWLGTINDTEYEYYKIPKDRVEKIINTITDICSCLSVRKTVYVRKVASLVGLISSTRNLYYIATITCTTSITNNYLLTRFI
jgi:hypothetical protein